MLYPADMTADNKALSGQAPGSVVLSHELRTFGLEAHKAQEMLEDLMGGCAKATLSICHEDGQSVLVLTSRANSPEECEEHLAPLFWDVRARLGEYLYGVDVDSLEQRVVQLLKQRGLTFSAAESCTGGLIAKRVTDVPGASAVFLGGVVSYTNGVKSAALGVPPSLLDEYGAVAAPVARAMAEGVRCLTGSDLAVSVTGVAGPDRDDRGNAVGTVFIGFASPEGTAVQRFALGTGRDRVRMLAAHHVFDILRRYLTGLPIE